MGAVGSAGVLPVGGPVVPALAPSVEVEGAGAVAAAGVVPGSPASASAPASAPSGLGTSGRPSLGQLHAELALEAAARAGGAPSGAAVSLAAEQARPRLSRAGELVAARAALRDARAALERGDARATLDRVLACLGGLL